MNLSHFETYSLKNKLKAISWPFFAIILAISLVSVALLFSAAEGNWDPWAFRQLQTIILFGIVMIIIPFIHISNFYRYSYHLYILGIILLIIAEVLGHKAMGAQRWIRLGVINFQPSELMKLFMILALSRFYHDLPPQEIPKIKNLIIPIVLIIVPVALILKQPNLGTSLIILFISGTIMFMAGIRAWKFVSVIVAGLAALPVVWSFMHDYQKRRVLTFLDPESDPLGAGYNIIQSMIGIGSGGLLGKGFMNGTQSQLSFLPEKQTDFIFAVLAEEFGFIGVITMFFLCFVVIGYCYLITITINHQFGRLVVIGVATSFALHIFVNTAMISGLIPVVGIPFPLLSYGGSNLMVFLMAFGIVQNCKINNRVKVK